MTNFKLYAFVLLSVALFGQSSLKPLKPRAPKPAPATQAPLSTSAKAEVLTNESIV